MGIITKTQAINTARTDGRYQSREGQRAQELMANNLGVNGDHMVSPVPEYISSPSDTIIRNNYNAWIILGRDRPSTRASGHGSTGDTHAACIDIVAGLMGVNAASNEILTGKTVYCDPDMTDDAARIYISQKTNIDDNFKLPVGKVGTSEHKSGIAIKADAVRIIAREGIKLVTRTDAKNSQGADILSVTGIDIIAGGNDEDLQPMVKGKNLAKALRRLSQHVANLNGIVDTLMTIQNDYNISLMHHWHSSPYFTVPTTPSVVAQTDGIKCLTDNLCETKKSLINNKSALGAWQSRYLKPSGGDYINSRWNNVN